MCHLLKGSTTLQITDTPVILSNDLVEFIYSFLHKNGPIVKKFNNQQVSVNG